MTEIEEKLTYCLISGKPFYFTLKVGFSSSIHVSYGEYECCNGKILFRAGQQNTNFTVDEIISLITGKVEYIESFRYQYRLEGVKFNE